MNANKNSLFHWNLCMFSKAHFNKDFWRVFFFSCSLCSISILDYKSHPVPVPASFFLSIAVCQRGNHCQQPNTDGQSQSNLPANAPETGNAFTHYLQRKNILKLPWTLWICKKGKGLKMEQKILYLPFVCEYGFNYKLSELWNNSNWFGG